MFNRHSSLPLPQPLVLFADAVGTSPFMMMKLEKMLCNISGIGFTVPIMNQEWKLKLKHLGEIHWLCFDVDEDEEPYYKLGCTNTTKVQRLSQDQGDELRNTVTSLLECWLYISGRLQMKALMQLLLKWIRAQNVSSLALVSPYKDFLTPRVLDAVPREVLLEEFVMGVMSPREGTIGLVGGTGISIVPLTSSAAAELEVGKGRTVNVLPGISSKDKETWTLDQVPMRPGRGDRLDRAETQVIMALTSFLSLEEMKKEASIVMAAVTKRQD